VILRRTARKAPPTGPMLLATRVDDRMCKPAARRAGPSECGSLVMERRLSCVSTSAAAPPLLMESTSGPTRPIFLRRQRGRVPTPSCTGGRQEMWKHIRERPLRPPGPFSCNLWSAMGARRRPLHPAASVRRACSSPFRGSGDGRLVCAGRPPPVRADDAASAASSRSRVCTQM